MSGGIAYVLDLDGDFREHCNTEMADLVALDDGDEVAEVRHMIERHLCTPAVRGRSGCSATGTRW